jgi:dynein regulatory complex protein 1
MEKFYELWIMNEERCKEMAQKLLDADRIVSEQQLGITWMPSDLEFMNNVGPIDATKIPKPSIDVVREILTDQPDENSARQTTTTTSHLSNISMKAILELLCDEGVSIDSIARIYIELFSRQGFSYRTKIISIT